MDLRVVPLSCVDREWLNDVKPCGPVDLHGMSLLALDDGLSGQPVDIRLPEAIGTMVDAPGSFRYVTGQDWKISREGDWSYAGTSRQRFNSTKEDVAFNGEVSCTTRVDGETLLAELTVRNGGFATWKSVYLWVCVSYSMAPAFDPQTLVSVGGKLVPYEQTQAEFFGAAGMRLLTAKGLAEVRRLREEGHSVNCPFPADVITDQARAARAAVDGREIGVVVSSDAAVLVGGYDRNPCTDLALGFGDLGPGERANASVAVRFTEEPLDGIMTDLCAELS